MNETFMKEKPKTAWCLPLMALPMAISMMVNALYKIVDSRRSSARINENAMTALSLRLPDSEFCQRACHRISALVSMR